jgi:disulfide bond formation protein DsbB
MSAQAINFYSTLMAILALASLLAALGLIAYRVVRGSQAATSLGGVPVWLAWLVALVASAGSLIYSEVIGFEPCRLCWFQRIAMYPMAVVLLVGAIRREAAVKLYALPLSLVGLGISIWHYLIQTFPSLSEGASCDPSVPCSAKYVDVFGFVSIPLMAGAGFTLISVLLLLYVRAAKQ